MSGRVRQLHLRQALSVHHTGEGRLGRRLHDSLQNPSSEPLSGPHGGGCRPGGQPLLGAGCQGWKAESPLPSLPSAAWAPGVSSEPAGHALVSVERRGGMAGRRGLARRLVLWVLCKPAIPSLGEVLRLPVHPQAGVIYGAFASCLCFVSGKHSTLGAGVCAHGGPLSF